MDSLGGSVKSSMQSKFKENSFGKNIKSRWSTLRRARRLNRHRIFSANKNAITKEKENQKPKMLKKMPLNELFVEDIQNIDKHDNYDHSSDGWIHVLENAMELQQNLADISDLIIQAFRFQLLLIISESFISITFDTYYMITVTFTFVGFRLPKEDVALFLLHHLFQPINNMIILVFAFRIVHNSFTKMQRIVNKLILYTKNDRLRIRLTQFAQQIQANTPKFTVYGLFAIDGSLLYTMVAATTTYSIILIQYSEDDDDEMNFTNTTIENL